MFWWFAQASRFLPYFTQVFPLIKSCLFNSVSSLFPQRPGLTNLVWIPPPHTGIKGPWESSHCSLLCFFFCKMKGLGKSTHLIKLLWAQVITLTHLPGTVVCERAYSFKGPWFWSILWTHLLATSVCSGFGAIGVHSASIFVKALMCCRVNYVRVYFPTKK